MTDSNDSFAPSYSLTSFNIRRAGFEEESETVVIVPAIGAHVKAAGRKLKKPEILPSCGRLIVRIVLLEIVK